MRELTMSEIGMGSGAGGDCPSGEGGGVGGIANPRTFGDDLIAIYDGLVATMSHIIETVADAL